MGRGCSSATRLSAQIQTRRRSERLPAVIHLSASTLRVELKDCHNWYAAELLDGAIPRRTPERQFSCSDRPHSEQLIQVSRQGGNRSDPRSPPAARPTVVGHSPARVAFSNDSEALHGPSYHSSKPQVSTHRIYANYQCAT